MSAGLVVCSECRREVHQDGPRQHTARCRCAQHDSGFCPAGWRHCEDKTLRCDGASSVYADTEGIVGRYCGRDAIA